MSAVAVREIAGRWWTPAGFVDGVCRHDTHVLAFEHGSPVSGIEARGDDAPSSSSPVFLPAPVDLHVHGGGGHDCMGGDAALRGMLRAHAEHGTGAMLATSVTAPFAEIDRFVESVARVMASPEAGEATLLGAHLEGPFINPGKLGAQPPHAASPDAGRLAAWLDSGVVRALTLAPEIDEDGALLDLCRRRGVSVQIGHTLCSWAEARRAFDAGCGVTHLYNAMSGVSHRGGGAATAALAYAGYAEIITDGLHVERAAFDAARRAIPGLYSVTDATAAAGMPDGAYRLGPLSVEKRDERVLLPDGTLAGSCLTQRASFAVLRGWGLGWHDVAALSSAVPARWLDDVTVGRTAPGAHAHWIELRGDEPVASWLGGRRRAWR